MAAGTGTAETFDYVIVGAGSAGCVLANRLTEDGRSTVCLIESGPPDRHPFIHIPGGFIKIAKNPRYAWQFTTEPSDGTAGRRINTTQGRTLGGSSSINGLNYTRGLPIDFDTWAQRGNRGWSYADLLPYFRRTESRITEGEADPLYRGSEGPVRVTDCDWRHPICDAFIEACHEVGVPRGKDYNGAQQGYAGYYQRKIHKGRRMSSAVVYLKPAKSRPNLRILTDAHVDRILFDGVRAVGVRYRRERGGEAREIKARREVIVSSGTANTAKLLQISGIGPAGVLGQLGVPVVRDLPVGENLQDHYSIRVVARVKAGFETINDCQSGPKLWREIARYFMGKPSILSVSPSVAGGFWKTDESLDDPDIQLLFAPASYRKSETGVLDAFPGLTAGFYQERPESVGWVRARSTDPFEAPAIQPMYLSAERDQRVAVAGIRFIRRLYATSHLARFIESETAPGAAATSDEDLLTFARTDGSTAYHLIGACRMGPADRADSVVTDELKVIGVEGLRVIDASIMPTMPSGNTGAATFMLAEKGADLIRGIPAPPRAEIPARAA
ncbi:GMC family oxidoreductase [Enterovirga rhinocerotis]|uniref:Choline dehydrogenase n=1 Tax=Enterovirga rhinocerotis TaxID=1339210 RepID=A0A4R7C4B4_9HYPH|nr:GMC family oxidoreductase N-terminal domain-containing protein [Enterovirga rhinocerotis]TDR93228.1 choline dehydrogenase [Enterovirga rhinocerotis]